MVATPEMGSDGDSRRTKTHPFFNRRKRWPDSEQLPPDISFLRDFGVSEPVLRRALTRSKAYSVSAAHSLMATGLVREKDYFRFAAFGLSLPFVSKVEGTARALYDLPGEAEVEQDERLLRVSDTPTGSDFDPLYLAPDCSSYDALNQFLEERPDLKSRCQITTLSAARDHVEETTSAARLSYARFGLRQTFPDLSARRVITARQAVIVLVLLQLIALLAFASPSHIVLAAHLTASFFYIGCVLLRLWAATHLARHRKRKSGAASLLSPDHEPTLSPDEGSATPVYSIMVALYGEAQQVPDLVDSLLQLDWPREKLEIKLVCEADDHATVAAVRATLAKLRTNIVHLVEVPAALPRTKPKALNYALPLCRGDYVVIYDAEDRPHPLQLREARGRFLAGEKNLGCLQAPLQIHNHSESLLSSQFALEYSALFKGLLPALSAHNLPLPLGGTSNHFRRGALTDTLGWDPYNVTEDADLGIRLARRGWSIGTLTYPTMEEAPVSVGVWIKQRTRWMKGWMQTVLVHLRHPASLHRDLGVRGSLIFYLLMVGMVVSSLVHPLFIALIGTALWMAPEGGIGNFLMAYPLFMFDVVTISLGYLAFAAIAWQTLPSQKLAALRGHLIFLPFYWLLISVAAWRALIHLFIKPHEWEKTPHRLSSEAVP